MSIEEKTSVTIIGYYMDEWKHRDTMYVKHLFTYFWASIIVSLSPYIKFIKKGLTDIFPLWVFHALGIIIACFAMMVSFTMGRRLSVVFEKYNELLGNLRPDYRHTRIPDTKLEIWLNGIIKKISEKRAARKLEKGKTTENTGDNNRENEKSVYLSQILPCVIFSVIVIANILLIIFELHK